MTLPTPVRCLIWKNAYACRDVDVTACSPNYVEPPCIYSGDQLTVPTLFAWCRVFPAITYHRGATPPRRLCRTRYHSKPHVHGHATGPCGALQCCGSVRLRATITVGRHTDVTFVVIITFYTSRCYCSVRCEQTVTFLELPSAVCLFRE